MPSATTRTLLVHGAMDEKTGRYRLETRHVAHADLSGGDTRHTMQLRSLEPDVYRWDTNVDMAIGPISAAEVSNLCVALFRAAEGRTEAQVREDYRSAFPRTSAVVRPRLRHRFASRRPRAGRRHERLRLPPASTPRRCGSRTRRWRNYLEKYLGPAKYHFTLADKDGTPLLDVAGRDRFVTLRYRIAEGRLVPLIGPVNVAGYAAADVRHQDEGEAVPRRIPPAGDRLRDLQRRARARDLDHRAARAGVGPTARHRAADPHAASPAVRRAGIAVPAFGARHRRAARRSSRGARDSTFRRARSPASSARWPGA